MVKKNSGMATASFVLGLCSLFLFWTWIVPLLSIIFGIISLNQINKKNLKGRKFAIWGICLGCVSIILLAVFMIFLVGSITKTFDSALDLTIKCGNNAVIPTHIDLSQNSYEINLLKIQGEEEINGVVVKFLDNNEYIYEHKSAGDIPYFESKKLSGTMQNVGNSNIVETSIYFLDENGKELFCPNSEIYSVDEISKSSGIIEFVP